MNPAIIRIPFSELHDAFRRSLHRAGLPPERADLVGRLFAENQRDGVLSHGLNRFPPFLASLAPVGIDVHADPEKVGGLGALEQWDGRMGLGMWNDRLVMDRTIALAREHGLGCVALRNTNHWMRAGAYALQAADAGCIGICWTNTMPLMPPWGSADVRIGNNPLAIAVPRSGGHLLLDMAMSQYSNGKLEVLRRQGRELLLAGGYDESGRLTRDPGAILATRRPVPIGYWKGSALAVVLDALAALLSGGLTTAAIGRQGAERAVSQVFLAIDVTKLRGTEDIDDTLDALITDLHAALPLDEGSAVRYPGEGMLRIRRESLENGVPVDAAQWEALQPV